MLSATLGGLLPVKKQKTQIAPVAFASRTTVKARRPAVSHEAKRLWLGAGLCVAIVVMLVTHIFSVNANVGMGYQVSSAQKKLAALKEDNKRLMLKVSETGSISRLQEDFSAENYVPVAGIEYVNAKPQNAVSMK